MQSEKRIYTTVARDRIVEEGDPEAAFLVAGEGGEVPNEYAHIYREYRKASKDEDAAEPRAAAGAPPDDKAPTDPDAPPDTEAPPDDDPDAKASAAPARTKARARSEDK